MYEALTPSTGLNAVARLSHLTFTPTHDVGVLEVSAPRWVRRVGVTTEPGTEQAVCTLNRNTACLPTLVQKYLLVIKPWSEFSSSKPKKCQLWHDPISSIAFPCLSLHSASLTPHPAFSFPALMSLPRFFPTCTTNFPGVSSSSRAQTKPVLPQVCLYVRSHTLEV